jgi:hypothetical protein
MTAWTPRSTQLEIPENDGYVDTISRQLVSKAAIMPELVALHCCFAPQPQNLQMPRWIPVPSAASNPTTPTLSSVGYIAVFKNQRLTLPVLPSHLHIHQNILRMQQHMRSISIMFIRDKYHTLRNYFVFNGVIGNEYTLRPHAIMMGKVDITYGLRISLFFSLIHKTKNSISMALQTPTHLFAKGPGIYVKMKGRGLWWLAIATMRAGTVIVVSCIIRCNAVSSKTSGPLGTSTFPLSSSEHSGPYVMIATVSLG